jgi:propionate CoA-transferase
MARIVTADEAVKLVPDGATVLVVPMPSEEVYPAFHRAYEATGSPKDLTFVWAAGLGPFSTERKGMNHFAYTGMTKRVIAGHVGLNHEMMKLIATNQIEAYNFPQGVMAQMYRDISAGRPGMLTRVGLGTFVDPRLEGGKLNERTRACEDLISVVTVDGTEMLFYKAFKSDVGIIRGTTADPEGNISMEDEAIGMECLEGAMAVKNTGGFVIVQVERVSDTPTKAHNVDIPGIFVDYVVVARSRHAHPHTLFVDHDPSYTGEVRVDLESEFQPMPLGLEKVLCRRACMELRPGDKANLGVGIPMGVAQVAHEEGLLSTLTLNTEVGVLGGLPQGGKNFGPAKNPTAFLRQSIMFDFYDGGGLNMACLGMAQVDREGNVNVSKIGPRVIGAGGFINITQGTKKVVFCGEFSAAGADIAVENGQVQVRAEGRVTKFVDRVEQITFSGRMARQNNQQILYVTERCVFELRPEGLMLTEIAPGIDLRTNILDRMGFTPIISPDLKVMDPRIFAEASMGLQT